MSEERDKVTVGLTPAGQENLQQVMGTRWFDAEMDAYRLAIAVALGRELPVEDGPLRGSETKFNVGSLDRDGQVRSLIASLVPDATRPYEHAEKLAEVGIKVLREGLVDGQQTLTSVVGGGDAALATEETAADG